VGLSTTKFRVPLIVSAGCTILTYELFAADAGLGIAEVGGVWYVTPTNTATHKFYSFRIRGLNPLCADITTQYMSLDVGCVYSIMTWPTLITPKSVNQHATKESVYEFTLPVSNITYCPGPTS